MAQPAVDRRTDAAEDAAVRRGASPLARRAALLFVVVGAGLRLWQYAGGASLWLDEIAVARNVLDRPLRELLSQPLAYDQVAPRGFLLVEKLAATLLGPDDHVLRLFPLLCSLAALAAFWRVAWLVLEGAGPPVAVALFATAVPLVAYGSQVKQYSSDVAAAVLLLWLALELRLRGASRRRALWAGVAGAVAAWFSQPAVLVLAGLGAALLLAQRRAAPAPRVPLGLLLPPWIVSAAAATLASFATTSAASRDYLRQFWAAGLLPLPIGRAIRSAWPLLPLRLFFGAGWHGSLGYPAPWLYVGLVVLGLVLLWRRRPALAPIVGGPLAVTLAAAAVRQYPVIDRLILFLLPAFVLAIAESVEWARRRLGRPALGAAAVLLLATPALAPIATAPPVYRLEDVKPALARLRASWRPGDRIYVYYGAVPAFTHYGHRYGFAPESSVLGGCHRGANRSYLEELDRLRGQPRVWVLITHAVPFYRETEDIGRYLDAIGVRREALVFPSRTSGFPYPPVELLLYDLGDAGRLAGAAAASFPIAGQGGTLPGFGCAHGPLAMAGSGR